jgi:hypothetical protein
VAAKDKHSAVDGRIQRHEVLWFATCNLVRIGSLSGFRDPYHA